MSQRVTGSSPAREEHQGWWWPRGATAAVVLILIAGTVAGAFATSRLVHDQEHRLLRQRAREVGTLFTNATSQLQQSLSTVGTASAIVDGHTERLVAMLQPLAATNGYRAVSVVDPTTRTVVVGAGADTAPGTVLPAQAAAALSRAGAQMVTTGVYRVGDQALVGFAVQPEGLAPLAVYAEAAINPAAQAPVTKGRPFSDLTVAVYASPAVEPAQLALATKDPPHGTTGTVQEAIQVGADRWTLLVKARRPLVGPLAAAVPWIILGGGLAVAIAVGAFVEVLTRRKTHVEQLVAKRTAELRTSMELLEEAQALLVQQERLAAIGELAAAVGHELRNPLGVVANAHFLLRTALEANGDTHPLRHLATAERDTATAALIVSDLLDYARPRQPIRTPFALAELVDEIKTVSPPPPGVVLHCDIAPEIALVEADRDQLRQVLLNLLSNAYEAMPGGGEARLGVSRRDETVDIEVTDTGTGMTPATRDRIFEPFFTDKARGVGLGLCVTKRIVDAHGGSIAVRSAPGQGTTFSVRLPLRSRVEAGRA